MSHKIPIAERTERTTRKVNLDTIHIDKGKEM